MAEWLRVSKRHPCPVCGKPDWCAVSADGELVLCQRAVSEWECHSTGGYFHKAEDIGSVAVVDDWSRRKHKVQAEQVDWDTINEQAKEAGSCCRIRKGQRQLSPADYLAEQIGISCGSLEMMGVGWSEDMQCWTFPMHDSAQRVIGMRTRYKSGAKRCIAGSKNGLFLPALMVEQTPCFICEGPTDAAAAIDCGVEAIGRPSCNGAVEMTLAFIRSQPPREWVVLADNDDAGYTGALKLCNRLAGAGVRVRKLTPPGEIGDLRDWARKGATARVLVGYARSVPFWMEAKV